MIKSLDMSEFKNMKKSKTFKISLTILISIIVIFCLLIIIRTGIYKQTKSANDLDAFQTAELNEKLALNYPQRYSIIHPLPYQLSPISLNVGAKSCILIDVANGNILYQKNANQIIPPASMTKLFAMYLVEEEVSAGNLRYEDYIELPPECWACNMPPHSSLMFLGKGHKVTVEELLSGLSICSGNDAAYALAYAICGNMDDFVERMNQLAQNLGLKNTHFVESSGYSELNTTTAYEMATFARVYVLQHPQSLAKFHSLPSFTYPKQKNLPEGEYIHTQDWSNGLPENITMSITQKNTNPLLGLLEGCDGLKTGYIDESGYNLTLTASRDGCRYLSVTMGGQGSNNLEGQQGRIDDGLELMEYAFSSFKDLDLSKYTQPHFIRVYGSKIHAINLLPAYDFSVESIPFISGDSIEDSLEKVKVSLEYPRYLFGEIQMGQECGKVTVSLDGYVLDTIPLVADRFAKKSNFIFTLTDKMITK